MKRKLLAVLMTLAMCLCLLPTAALAEDTTTTHDGKSADTAVTTVGELKSAIEAATDGDTIYLGEGKFTTYGNSSPKKSLTFVGVGEKTEWGIGATVPDPSKFGTEYNGDYSFDGCGSITFKNMTLQSANQDYLGFIRIDNITVENCTINGRTHYWGYQTTVFKNVTFNAPEGNYALWATTGHEFTFDTCIFNISGKAVNAYFDYTDAEVTINYSNCTVNSTAANKSVLNIKDKTTTYIINISGKNTVDGLDPNNVTCSRLFQVETTYPVTAEGEHYSTVTIDGTTVWNADGMVAHAIDCENDKYTDGYKDDAFTYSEWVTNEDGTQTRTKTCDYCGYVITETKSDKVSYPGIDKNIVTTDSEGKETLVKSTSISAGEEVKYQLTSNVPQDLTNYLEADPVPDPEEDPGEEEISLASFNDKKNGGKYKLAFHDVLDSNLTINKDSVEVVEVKVKDTTLGLMEDGTIYVGTGDEKTEVGSYEFDRKCAADTTDTLYVELDLVKLYKAGVFTEDDFGAEGNIIVTYTATASSELKPGDYKNAAWVEYEEGETEKPEVDVYSYGIKVFKYDTADETKGLSGAVFTLYSDEDLKQEVATLTSGEGGYASTETGLKEGTYYLQETTAPEGYAKSNTALPVTLSKDTADATTYIVNAKFANSLIPHTGGQGRMMFTYVAIGLAAAAACVFVFSGIKRRREDSEN